MPAMFETGAGPDKAWHGLMKVVDGLQTAKEMIVAAGLDWEVEKLPMIVRVPGGADRRDTPIGARLLRRQIDLPVPGKFAQVRTSDNAVLGTVGSVYTDVSNSKAFAWADALVGGFGAHYKTAGSLYGGRVVWVLLEVPFTVKSPDGELRTMLYLRNSHDGSSPLTVGFTTVDIVCANTLMAAEATALDKVSIRHTLTAEQRLATAQTTMHLVEGSFRQTWSDSEICEEAEDEDGTPLRGAPIVNELLFPPRRNGIRGLRHEHYLPPTIRQIYKEKMYALLGNQPILSGIAIRALVEAVCAHYRATGSNLKKRIDDLAEKRKISHEQRDSLHRCRCLGNEAAHEAKVPGDDELEIANDIADSLLEAAFVHPILRERLPIDDPPTTPPTTGRR